MTTVPNVPQKEDRERRIGQTILTDLLNYFQMESSTDPIVLFWRRDWNVHRALVCVCWDSSQAGAPRS